MHVCNHLSMQACCTLLCLSNWSKLRLVKTEDEKAVVHLNELEGDESDYKMEKGWDVINT